MIFTFRLFEWAHRNKCFLLTISFNGNDYCGWHDYVGIRFSDQVKTIKYDKFRRNHLYKGKDYSKYINVLCNHASASNQFEKFLNNEIDILSLPLISII
jgi:hypothetical protein